MPCLYLVYHTSGEFISGANLLANAIRHEAGTTQSHYNNYVVAQNNAANNLGTAAEAKIDGPSVAFNSFLQNVTDLLNSKQAAINTAFLVEPCGASDVRLDANCTFQGNINFAPYQSCQ